MSVLHKHPNVTLLLDTETYLTEPPPSLPHLRKIYLEFQQLLKQVIFLCKNKILTFCSGGQCHSKLLC